MSYGRSTSMLTRSGSLLTVARRSQSATDFGMGAPAIGIEIEERYCEIAAERCRQEVLDLGGAA